MHSGAQVRTHEGPLQVVVVVVIQFIIEDNLQLQYCYTFHFLIKAIITTIQYYDNPPPRHPQDELYHISPFGFPTYA